MCIVLVLVCCGCGVFVDILWFFFFKQKTAYEMRISDWSSDVCSSDLHEVEQHAHRMHSYSPSSCSRCAGVWSRSLPAGGGVTVWSHGLIEAYCEIGRASCRERVCQYV